METFFANSDAHIFFGSTDTLTLEYISQAIGTFTAQELTPNPPSTVAFDPSKHEQEGFRSPDQRRAAHDAKQQDNLRIHNHLMTLVGKRRIPPGELAALIGKGQGDKLARAMIVFGPRRDILKLRLLSYFDPQPAPIQVDATEEPPRNQYADEPERSAPPVRQIEVTNPIAFGVIGLVLVGWSVVCGLALMNEPVLLGRFIWGCFWSLLGVPALWMLARSVKGLRA